MQVTIEITQEEYMQIEEHIKRAIVMSQIGMGVINIADKILGRLCVAVSEKARESQKDSRVILPWPTLST